MNVDVSLDRIQECESSMHSCLIQRIQLLVDVIMDRHGFDPINENGVKYESSCTTCVRVLRAQYLGVKLTPLTQSS